MKRMYRYEPRIKFMHLRIKFWENFDQLERVKL
jgi:hypothetical protein